MTAQHTGFARIPGTAVDLCQVSHAFQADGDRVPVLDRMTVRIEPGALVAVLGPRGCGKSTLLRLVAGHAPPSAGKILLDGETTDAPPHLLLSREPKLSASKTVHAQVAAAVDLRRGPGDAASYADQALRLLGLNRFAGACPRELTTATAQRVSLAIALANDPRLLLLDDPFARLDPIARVALQGDLVSLWQRSGCTMLLATNDVDETLSVATRIIVIGAQPARVTLDIALDCEFPRRPADPCLAGVRHTLLQALEEAGASHGIGRSAARHATPFTGSGGAALTVWPGDELVTRHAAAVA